MRSCWAKCPSPTATTRSAGLFPHMHVKDARKNAQTGKLEWAPVGGGIIDFKGQFAGAASG